MRITYVLFGLALLVVYVYSSPIVKREAESEDLNPLNEVRPITILFDERAVWEGKGGRQSLRSTRMKSRENHGYQMESKCGSQEGTRCESRKWKRLFRRFIILQPLTRIQSRCSSEPSSFAIPLLSSLVRMYRVYDHAERIRKTEERGTERRIDKPNGKREKHGGPKKRAKSESSWLTWRTQTREAGYARVTEILMRARGRTQCT